MENIRWICIQLRQHLEKKDWYNENTLSYTRRGSKRLLLHNSSMYWNEAKKYGWRCIKVKVSITPL